MTVQLHGAFAWDCPDCGVENFHRCVEGDIDADSLEQLDLEPMGDMVARPDELEIGDDEDASLQSQVLVQRVVFQPKWITCGACKRTFETEPYCGGEDED